MDTLDSWAEANGMKFNKTKCQALHLAIPLGVIGSNPKHHYRPEAVWLEDCVDETGLRVLVAAWLPYSHEGQWLPGLYQK